MCGISGRRDRRRYRCGRVFGLLRIWGRCGGRDFPLWRYYHQRWEDCVMARIEVKQKDTETFEVTVGETTTTTHTVTLSQDYYQKLTGARSVRKRWLKNRSSSCWNGRVILWFYLVSIYRLLVITFLSTKRTLLRDFECGRGKRESWKCLILGSAPDVVSVPQKVKCILK